VPGTGRSASRPDPKSHPRASRSGRAPALDRLRRQLREAAEPARLPALRRAFKTRPGEYGEGDIVLGVQVPNARAIARLFEDIGLELVAELLRSPVHDERLVALLILTRRFKAAADDERDRIFAFYLDNTAYVNNWDLVDTSAPAIVGAYLLGRSREALHRLARSPSVWERRIAIVSTLTFVRAGDLDETFRLALVLLHDDHDLVHKAVGWMLREVGRRDPARLLEFLDRHAAQMSRLTLGSASRHLDRGTRERVRDLREDRR
jgi:3-methyladenine DNA glycosylase AlkD